MYYSCSDDQHDQSAASGVKSQTLLRIPLSFTGDNCFATSVSCSISEAHANTRLHDFKYATARRTCSPESRTVIQQENQAGLNNEESFLSPSAHLESTLNLIPLLPPQLTTDIYDLRSCHLNERHPGEIKSARGSISNQCPCNGEAVKTDIKMEEYQRRLEAKRAKRRIQNRVAQREYRRRKEQHAKDLQARVDEIENMVNQKLHENQELKAQLENLRAKNKLLKAVSEAVNRCFHCCTPSQLLIGYGSQLNLNKVQNSVKLAISHRKIFFRASKSPYCNICFTDASNAADRDQTSTWWSRGRLLLPEDDIIIRLEQIYGEKSDDFA